MVYEWKDQVVLITGAATGIGERVVRLVLEEGAKHVAILDIAEAAGIELQNELNSKHGENKVKFYTCDVTNEDLFLGIFKKVKDEHGYIDVVVNNAGLMNDRLNVYKKEIQVNVTALITSTLKAIEYMRKDKGGRGGAVVNVASTVAISQGPALPIYYATKAAVLQFSNCIGMDEYYSRTGVRVIAVCFGATATPLLTPQKFGCFDEEFENTTMNEIVKSAPKQTADSAAKGLVDAYKYGESGSTWLVDADKPAVDITSDVTQGYQTMSSKVQF